VLGRLPSHLVAARNAVSGSGSRRYGEAELGSRCTTSFRRADQVSIATTGDEFKHRAVLRALLLVEGRRRIYAPNRRVSTDAGSSETSNEQPDSRDGGVRLSECAGMSLDGPGLT